MGLVISALFVSLDFWVYSIVQPVMMPIITIATIGRVPSTEFDLYYGNDLHKIQQQKAGRSGSF